MVAPAPEIEYLNKPQSGLLYVYSPIDKSVVEELVTSK